MTNAEARRILLDIADQMPSDECADWIDAISLGIKALEQTDILDRIITQIEQARDKDKLCEYPYNRCINIIKEEIKNENNSNG